MLKRISIILAFVFGIVHFLVVGVPFIYFHGGGEQLAWIVLYADLPLFLLAQKLASNALYNSVAFNFWLFPVMGSLMMLLLGIYRDVGSGIWRKRMKPNHRFGADAVVTTCAVCWDVRFRPRSKRTLDY